MSVSKAMFGLASKRLYRHLSYSDDEDPFISGDWPFDPDKPYFKVSCLLHTESLVLRSHHWEGCWVTLPDHVDILYLAVDPRCMFCEKVKVCPLIQSMSPRVLIIRDLATLADKAAFKCFYGGYNLEKLVAYAFDDDSLPGWQLDRFYMASEMVIICKGAPSRALLNPAAEHGLQARSSSPSDIHVRSNGDDHTYPGVSQENQDSGARAFVNEAQEDPDSTHILPPYVHTLAETTCFMDHRSKLHLRKYTIVDAHLWDPHLRDNYDDKDALAITRALQAMFDRILESRGRAAPWTFTVQSESEFMDANPEVAGCIDEFHEVEH